MTQSITLEEACALAIIVIAVVASLVHLYLNDR